MPHHVVHDVVRHRRTEMTLGVGMIGSDIGPGVIRTHYFGSPRLARSREGMRAVCHTSRRPPGVGHPGVIGPGCGICDTRCRTLRETVSVAASAESIGLTLLLFALAAGSALLAIGWVASLGYLIPIGGIVLVASAAFAFYTASAMLLQGMFGRVVLPVGKPHAADRPGAIPVQPIQYEYGEPGVKLGQ